MRDSERARLLFEIDEMSREVERSRAGGVRQTMPSDADSNRQQQQNKTDTRNRYRKSLEIQRQRPTTREGWGRERNIERERDTERDIERERVRNEHRCKQINQPTSQQAKERREIPLSFIHFDDGGGDSGGETETR
jgi:hypothetical protein